MNRLRIWWLRLRGYKRFEVKDGRGHLIQGLVKRVDYDPRNPRVTYSGYTNIGTRIEFYGYNSRTIHENCRCTLPDIQDVIGHLEEHAAPE